jgi:hypothetical protein
MKTLITEHWAGQVRGAGANAATRVVPIASVVGRDPRSLFVAAYPTFADRCREVEEPGLAVIAVDERTGRASGMAILRAQVRRHVAVIVGRHDRADLYVPDDAALSLRHLAVVMAPVAGWDRGAGIPSYRILDLRSESGTVDESGRRLQGIRCEGAALLRCGANVIFALPLGDPTDWPVSATDAWSQLPERVYHDELLHVPDASEVKPRVSQNRRNTVVTRISGPRDLAASLADREDVAGELTLEGPVSRRTISIGDRALRHGVLIGRYARCDMARTDEDNSLSRVHALLLHVDEQLLLIDTASTNGSRLVSGADARVIPVSEGGVIELGHATSLRWRWRS